MTCRTNTTATTTRLGQAYVATILGVAGASMLAAALAIRVRQRRTPTPAPDNRQAQPR